MPWTIEVDLRGVTPGTEATLYFDLISFGEVNSSVTIDNVILSADRIPSLAFGLDPATDSGTLGDDLTNFNLVNLIGTTDAMQEVLLDVDGDGFDDGSAQADAAGQFTFYDVPLAEGGNQVRMQATAAGGAREVARTIGLDTQAPSGSLVAPLPDSLLNQDPGHVDIQWTDLGPAGLDPATFGPEDIVITGATITEAQSLGNGLVRYSYSGSLPEGVIEVALNQDAVSDLAANSSGTGTDLFTIDTLAPTGALANPVATSLVNADLGYVDVAWIDLGAAGLDIATFDAKDITVTGVTVDQALYVANGVVRYFYGTDGDTLADGTIEVVQVAGEVADLAGNTNATKLETFILDTQPPTGALVTPVAGSATNQDLGYVEIQWTDAGPAGLNLTTFDTGDLTITGVTVNHIEHLGNGLVRYWYNDDESLADGLVEIVLPAGAVSDLATNPSDAKTESFTLDTQPPSGILLTPPVGSIASQDLGYVEIQWTDAGAAGLNLTTFDTSDLTITGVTVDHIEHLDNGLVRYWYNDDGDALSEGTVQVALNAGAVTDLVGNPSLADAASFVFNLPPVVTVGLANDTAPDGYLAGPLLEDLLTNDPAVAGTVVDTQGIDRLEASVDGQSYVDVAGDLQNGQFEYDPGSLVPGPHSVAIRATDTHGLASEQTITFLVNHPPVADAGMNHSVEPGTTVTCDASSSSDQEGIYAYQWTFHDGATFDGLTASREYPEVGVFPVQLSVTDTAGSQVSAEVLVTVQSTGVTPLIPVATKDDGEWAYRQRGVWNIYPGGWKDDYRTRPPGVGSYYAMWMMRVPRGEYEVYATWVSDTQNAADASYKIKDGYTLVGTVLADQRGAPDDGSYDGAMWESLGVFTFNTGVVIVDLNDLAGGTVVADGIIVVPAGSPLHQAGSDLEMQHSGETLTADVLQPIAAAATAQWTAIQENPEVTTTLVDVEFRVTDLAGSLLGLASPGVVWIDQDAAGHGWFVDPTPAEHGEFQFVDAGEELRAERNGPAVERMDLLTVVSHELGHLLGLRDLSATDHPHDLMAESLPIGVRRLPDTNSLSTGQAEDVRAEAPRSPLLGAPADGDSLSALAARRQVERIASFDTDISRTNHETASFQAADTMLAYLVNSENALSAIRLDNERTWAYAFDHFRFDDRAVTRERARSAVFAGVGDQVSAEQRYQLPLDTVPSSIDESVLEERLDDGKTRIEEEIQAITVHRLLPEFERDSEIERDRWNQFFEDFGTGEDDMLDDTGLN